MSNSRRPDDPSVEAEPHLQKNSHFQADEDDSYRPGRVPSSEHSAYSVDHHVWDEPGLAGFKADAFDVRQTDYHQWRLRQAAKVSPLTRWATLLGVLLMAGPFAIVGALMDGGRLGAGIMSVAVFGPAVEEILKVALVLWIVERRPYLFKNISEILLCGLAGGIVFAVIENIVYLQVYIPDPSPEIVRWRWTICVLLHTSCSGIAAWGIGREWRSSLESRRRPQMGNTFRFLVAAVFIHGLYNGVMTLLSMGGYGF